LKFFLLPNVFHNVIVLTKQQPYPPLLSVENRDYLPSVGIFLIQTQNENLD